MATKRSAPRPPKTDAESVAKAAAADKQRKALSKAALRKATRDVPETDPKPRRRNKAVDAPAPDTPTVSEDFLAALRDDAVALGARTDEEIAAYVASQTAAPEPKAADGKTPYSGPMLALKTARQTYVKAANGVLCNGSPLALLCGQYKREVVVTALVNALKLPGNPYAHLNPGQQSMNLRNKARHQINEGQLSLAEIEAALKAAAN